MWSAEISSIAKARGLIEKAVLVALMCGVSDLRKLFQDVYGLCMDVKSTCEEAGVAKIHTVGETKRE